MSIADKMKEMKIFQTCDTNSITEGGHNCVEGSSGNKTILTPADIAASKEPLYTTWKIREEGEVCHTIDYIFYSKDKFTVRIKVNFY